MYDNGDCWGKYAVRFLKYVGNNTHVHLTKIYYWFFTDCMWTFIHDGICDDKNNREECDWDGFDCCLEDIYIIDEYCNECLCHLDDENNNTSTEKGVPP